MLAAPKDEASNTYTDQEHNFELQSPFCVQFVNAEWLPSKQAGGEMRLSKEEDRLLAGSSPEHSLCKAFFSISSANGAMSKVGDIPGSTFSANAAVSEKRGQYW